MKRQILKTENLERNARILIIFALAFSAATYVYLVAATTLMASSVNDAHNGIAALKMGVGELESAYMTGSHTLTPALAHSMGFVDTSEVAYVVAGGASAHLSLSQNPRP
jgi:hypothetical protein